MDDARLRRVGYASLVVSIAATATIARAQTGPDLLLGSFPENKNLVFNGEAIFGANSSSDNNDEHTQLSIYNASGRVKLDIDQFAPDWKLNRAQPRAGFDFTLLEIDSDDPSLPDQFSDQSIGFGMGVAAGEKYRAGLTFAVGHASADPFADGNGWYGKADFAIGYDFNANETIGFVLDYDGNRTFLPDVPLPGFIYTRRFDNDRYTLKVGFPYSELEWRPNEHWSLALRYNIPDRFEANAEYEVTKGFSVFAALSDQYEAFHWDSLSDSSDRVLFHQTRAELGIRGGDNEGLSFVVAGGYAFDQSFEVGWDSRDTDHLADVDAAPYVRVGVQWNF